MKKTLFTYSQLHIDKSYSIYIFKQSSLLALISLLSVTQAYAKILDLKLALTLAKNNDPWMQQSKATETATKARSEAIAWLPSPTVSLSMANLPTNGFALNQEPMTQLKVGVSQMLPRGDTTAIRRKQILTLAKQHPYLRIDRQAKIAMMVKHAWLEAFRAQASIELISQNRALFKQLLELINVNYVSAVTQTRQQDILRAQLEIMRIDDKLLTLDATKNQHIYQLQQWIMPQMKDWPMNNETWQFADMQANQIKLPSTITYEFDLSQEVVDKLDLLTTSQLAALAARHPFIKASDQRIKAADSEIELAEQQHRPQWGLNASYGHRQDDTSANSRADFLSIGVSFDMPLFNSSNIDKQISASINEKYAKETQKRLIIREFISGITSTLETIAQLGKRKQLYAQDILSQMSQHSEATLNAFTANDGQFSEVIRARIIQLEGELAALNIQIDLYKSQASLAYYIPDDLVQMDKPDSGSTATKWSNAQ